MPEGRAGQPDRCLEHVRNPERAERSLERRSHAIDGGDDHADLLWGDALTKQGEDLLADELEHGSRAGRLEEANRAVEPRVAPPPDPRRAAARGTRARGEWYQPCALRSSTDGPASPARSLAVRSSDSKAGRPGSYGSETQTSARAASASSRAHWAPPRSSKPYTKTGELVPGRELAAHEVGRTSRSSLVIPDRQALAFRLIRAEEPCELAVELVGRDTFGLELGDRIAEGVKEPAEAG